MSSNFDYAGATPITGHLLRQLSNPSPRLQLQLKEHQAEPDWSAWEASFNTSDPEGTLEVAGLKERTMVGVAGIEPATPRV